MDGRIFFDTRYLFEFKESGEYMAIFSGIGNEDLT